MNTGVGGADYEDDQQRELKYLTFFSGECRLGHVQRNVLYESREN